jgi:hypothetical protein
MNWNINASGGGSVGWNNAPGVIQPYNWNFGPPLSFTFTNNTGAPINMSVTGTSGPGSGSGPTTDYAINPYINSDTGSLTAANGRRRIETIPDGSSNTILFGHAYIGRAQYPTTTSDGSALVSIFAAGTLGTARNSLGNTALTWLQDGTNTASNQWGSPLPNGGLMAMADGSVRLIPYTVPLTNLLRIDDGQVVNLP